MKRKAGRPKTDAPKRKTCPIRIALSPEEMAALKEKSGGRHPAQTARELLLAGLEGATMARKEWTPDKELLKALKEDEGMTKIEAWIDTDDYGIGHYMIDADSPVSGRWRAESQESHPRDWKWEEIG